MGVYTDSYHLHMTTLQVAMETSIRRWLGLEVSIVTAIAIVGDIVDGNLLFHIHDWEQKTLRRPGRRGEVGRVERRDVAHDRKRRRRRVGRRGCYVREARKRCGP